MNLERNNMLITSTAFDHNEMIPSNYTCDGQGLNPPLNIDDVPEKTQSFALILDDPDAPGGDFVHWVVWNIPADTKEILGDSIPKGATEGLNSGGRNGYLPPCPPSGIHHYQFKLYALDKMLLLPPEADKNALLQEMEGHILEREEITGLYKKQG